MLTTTTKEFVGISGTLSLEVINKLRDIDWNIIDYTLPVPFEAILDRIGFEDALSLVEIIEGHEGAIRFFACWCAKRFLLPAFREDNPLHGSLSSAIKVTELLAAGKLSKDSYRSIPVVKSSHWHLTRFPTNAAAQGVVQECFHRLSHMASQKNASAGQIVSETDTEAIAFCKRCRLKYRIEPAGAAPDNFKESIERAVVIEKMTQEFRNLCRLEGRYAQFAQTSAPTFPAKTPAAGGRADSLG